MSAIADEPAGVQLFALTAQGLDAPPPLPSAGVDAAGAGAGQWQAFPPGAVHGLVRGPASRYLWVGGRLGVLAQPPAAPAAAPMPALHQVRVAAADEDIASLLPAIYRRPSPDAPATVLDGIVELLGAALSAVEGRFDDLPSRFEPAAVSDAPGPAPSPLRDLAELVAADLAECRTEEQRRAVVAAAFADSGRRGTAAGLRDAIARAIGVQVRIEEPGQAVSAWALGRTSRLGSGTVLAAGEPAGFIVGSSDLDGARLPAASGSPAPVLTGLAGRFTVSVAAPEIPDRATADRLRRLVERERPAHVEAHVCVVGPRMRVGWQARVGLDAVVAGRPPAFRLGDGTPLGSGAGGLGSTALADTSGETVSDAAPAAGRQPPGRSNA